jgi:hypothetical protein
MVIVCDDVRAVHNVWVQSPSFGNGLGCRASYWIS